MRKHYNVTVTICKLMTNIAKKVKTAIFVHRLFLLEYA